MKCDLHHLKLTEVRDLFPVKVVSYEPLDLEKYSSHS